MRAWTHTTSRSSSRQGYIRKAIKTDRMYTCLIQMKWENELERRFCLDDTEMDSNQQVLTVSRRAGQNRRCEQIFLLAVSSSQRNDKKKKEFEGGPFYEIYTHTRLFYFVCVCVWSVCLFSSTTLAPLGRQSFFFSPLSQRLAGMVERRADTHAHHGQNRWEGKRDKERDEMKKWERERTMRHYFVLSLRDRDYTLLCWQHRLDIFFFSLLFFFYSIVQFYFLLLFFLRQQTLSVVCIFQSLPSCL